MSKQLNLDSGPLSQEEIDDLYTRWPVEKVEYWVAEAQLRADAQLDAEDDDDEEADSEKD